MANCVIMKVNVEFHGPHSAYNTSSEEFDSLMEEVVSDSGYLPIYMADPQNHLRAAFANFRDQLCVQKFISPFLAYS